MENLKTSIKISKETRDILAAMCKKDDTFEDIIIELINNQKVKK